MIDCINVVDFFQILGAIATTVAVALALWQTGYNSQKKIKIIIDELVEAESFDYANKTKTISMYITFCLTNTGRYDASLRRVEIQKDKNYQGDFVTTSAPLNIKVNESSELRVHWFGKIGEFKKGEKIIFTDSTNKKYKIRIKQNDINLIKRYPNKEEIE